MSLSTQETRQTSPEAIAEGFWMGWITDPQFRPEVSDPATAAMVEVAQEYTLTRNQISGVVWDAFHRVLDAEQARQQDELREQ